MVRRRGTRGGGDDTLTGFRAKVRIDNVLVQARDTHHANQSATTLLP